MDNQYYIEHINNYKGYILINKDYKYIIYTIHKNMSTKLRNEIKNKYKINKTNKYRRFKEIMNSIDLENDKIIKELNNQNIENIPKIAFVRNPINRLISLFFYFKNLKISKKLQIFENTNINDWIINYFSKNFKEIKKYANNHFDTQTSFIFFNKKPIPQEIIKIENINYNKLKEYNIELSQNEINKSKKEPIELSEESINIIKKTYKHDFYNFKY